MRTQSNTVASDHLFTQSPGKIRPRNRRERDAVEAAGRALAMRRSSRKGPARKSGNAAPHKRPASHYAGGH